MDMIAATWGIEGTWQKCAPYFKAQANSSKENCTYHSDMPLQTVNRRQTNKFSEGTKLIIALRAHYRLRLSLDPKNT